MVTGIEPVEGTRARRLILCHRAREEPPGAVAGAVVHPVPRQVRFDGGEHGEETRVRIQCEKPVPGRQQQASACPGDYRANRLARLPRGVPAIAGQAMYLMCWDIRPVQGRGSWVPARALTQGGPGHRELAELRWPGAGLIHGVRSAVAAGSTATQSISTRMPGREAPTVVRAGRGRGNASE